METNKKPSFRAYPALPHFLKADIVHRIVAFALVGGIGFLIDGGLLSLAVEIFKLSPYFSRLISFPPAVTATWYFNRRWTFAATATNKKKKEYTRYFTIQIIGALLNLAIYFLLIYYLPLFAIHPVIPFAIASLAAMAFNFLGAQLFVFTGARKSGHADR